MKASNEAPPRILRRSWIRRYSAVELLIILVLGSAAPGAQPDSAEPDPGLDPTVFHSRAKLTNEFQVRESDALKNTTKLNLSYAPSYHTQRDWTMRIDLPLVVYRAGDNDNFSDAAGIGDIEVRAGHVFDPGGVFRWGLGVEAQFNTPAEPQLGDGVFRISPALVFAVQANRVFKFQTTTQFNEISSRRAGVADQQEVETKPAITLSLPGDFYAYVENSLKWQLQQGGGFDSKLKVETGRGFGSRNQWESASATRNRSPRLPRGSLSPSGSLMSFRETGAAEEVQPRPAPAISGPFLQHADHFLHLPPPAEAMGERDAGSIRQFCWIRSSAANTTSTATSHPINRPSHPPI